MTQNSAPILSNSGGVLTGESDFKFSSTKQVLVATDGTLVMSTPNELIRLNANGTPDLAFGKGSGRAPVATIFNNIALAPDGKILVYGYKTLGGWIDNDIYLYRFNGDGSPDTSFGAGAGFVRADMGGFDSSGSITIEPDGKILLMGSSTSLSYQSPRFAARYLADGTIDASFGNGGVLFESAISGDLIKQTDGSYVAWSATFNTGHERYYLQHYTANGQLAPRGDAMDQTTLASKDGFFQLSAFQSDGRFITGTYARVEDAHGVTSFTLNLQRYLKDGQSDPDFGHGGTATAGFDSSTLLGLGNARLEIQLIQMRIAPDGKIVVAGTANSYIATQESADIEAMVDGQYIVLRYNQDGSADTSFGTGGRTTVDLGAFPGAILNSLDFGPDGSVMLGGAVLNPSLLYGAVVRLTPEGKLDTSFSNHFSDSNAIAYAAGFPADALNPHIVLADADVAQAGASGNYGGATLTLLRQGGAVADDSFSATGPLHFTEGRALLDAIDIGTVSNADGVLRIAFNSAATPDRVNAALQSIGYRNTDGAIATRHLGLGWTFADGSGGVATFTSKVDITPIAAPYWIDALLPGAAADYNAATKRLEYLNLVGPEKTIKIAFPWPDAPLDDPRFRLFDTSEQAKAWRVLDEVSSFADLHFVPAAQAGNNGEKTISFYTWSDTGHRGHATYMNESGANVWASPVSKTISMQASTLLHEVGHALGMQHPFPYQNDGRSLPTAEQDREWSVMAYSDSRSEAEQAHVVYSVLDIAALQYVYGPSKTARVGNDSYHLNPSQTNFIWDGAGVDTISAAGLSADLTLHLVPGHWDYLGKFGPAITSAGQVTINFGSEIENAVGGNGNDNITGNALANKLEGGAGNDRLSGAGGDDTLDGGAGTDSALYNGKRADYLLSKTNDGIRVSGPDGADLLVNMERIVFADITLDISDNTIHICGLYRAAFGRAPDPSGLAFWSAALEHGASITSIAQGFIQSDEFGTLYGADHSAASFLDRLYQQVFQRPPDSPGKAWWLSQLDNGATEADILAAFSHSAESEALIIGVPTLL